MNDMKPFTEVDRRALELVTMSATDASEFKRKRLAKQLNKRFREGKMFYGANEDPFYAWHMCEARLLLGDYSNWNGWQFRGTKPPRERKNELSWAATMALKREKDGVQRWRGQRAGRLYVYGEQGIGDEIFYGTALRWALTQVDSITLETDVRLMVPLSRSLGIETVMADVRQQENFRPMGKVEGDAWTLLGDLLVRSGPQPKPYLKASEDQVKRFAHYKGQVGISWRGNQGSYKHTDFGRGVSLQYDQGWDEDVEKPRDNLGNELDLRSDIEGILGLLSNLDKIVTVSTSVAHMAAALGCDTEVILAPRNGPNSSSFPWKWWNEKTPGRSLWYESVSVYRDLRDYRARHVGTEPRMGRENRAA